MTKWSIIPNNAVVTGISLKWDVSQYGWNGMYVELSNQRGKKHLWTLNGASTSFFNDQPVKQVWSVRFFVQSWSKPGKRLMIAPEMIIYWQ